jgi:hypothetical protein
MGQFGVGVNSMTPAPASVVATGSRQSPSQANPLATEDADYLGALLDMFEPAEPEINDSPPGPPLESSGPLAENPGQVFLNWVRAGIQSHKLIINDSKAKIHTVSGTVFLVTPGIFQRYAQEFPDISLEPDQEGEEWRWVQKQFEKLKVHRKCDDSLNIWTCQIKGPRKTAKLKGYLLEDPELIFESLAPENPYLMLEVR